MALKYLVTGGAGFIGSNYVHRLVQRGEKVTIYDNLSRAGVEHNLQWLIDTHGSLVQVEVADTRNAHAVKRAVNKASVVFHLAAQVAVTTSLVDPVHDFDVNARGTLHVQRVTLGNTIRGLLRTEGIAFPTRGTRFTEHVLGSIGGTEPLLAIIRPLLDARATIVRQLAVLDRQIIDIAKRDGICRRLMTVPGVGPHMAVAFKACVDDPARFSRSRPVGAHLGLMPRRYSSGQVDYSGRISKMGDAGMRRLLYVAANAMITRGSISTLKDWALRLVELRGVRRAKVALARRLAVTLHAMWRNGSPFRATPLPAAS